MPLPPITPKLGGPGAAGGGLGGFGGLGSFSGPSAGLPSSPGLGGSLPPPPPPATAPPPATGPAGEVPPNSRSIPGMAPMPGYTPGPAMPPGPVGLQGLAPPSTVLPVNAPATLAPPPILPPDASGVTPPPGTPQPMMTQAPPAPGTTEAAPPPTGREQGIQSVAPPTSDAGNVAPAQPAAPVTPQPEAAPADAGGYDYADKKKGPEEGFFDSGEYAGWINPETGLIQYLPDVNAMAKFIADAGIGGDLAGRFINLAEWVEKVGKIDPNDPNQGQALQNAIQNINRIAQYLGTKGWNFDTGALIQGGVAPPTTPPITGPSTGDGAFGAPGSGGAGGPGGGFGPGPGSGGGSYGGPVSAGPPSMGGSQGPQLGTIDPDESVIDIFRNASNPEERRAMMDWQAYIQARDDRQLAIDQYGGLKDFYQNDPTRQASYDYLGAGPNYTYSPEDIERMKTSGRTQAGYGMSSLDQSLREAAAAAGIPTATLSALMAQGRTDILNNLLGENRALDLLAAQQRGQDEQQYYSNLMNAQGTLVGPMASYYGGLAGLISGAPGLAQTGNPMAGLAEFGAYQNYMNSLNRGPSGFDQAITGIGGLGGLLGGTGQFVSGLKA